MFRICSSGALLIICGARAALTADVLLIETTHVTAGQRKIDGVRTTYIKGAEPLSDTLFAIPDGWKREKK